MRIVLLGGLTSLAGGGGGLGDVAVGVGDGAKVGGVGRVELAAGGELVLGWETIGIKSNPRSGSTTGSGASSAGIETSGFSFRS